MVLNKAAKGCVLRGVSHSLDSTSVPDRNWEKLVQKLLEFCGNVSWLIYFHSLFQDLEESQLGTWPLCRINESKMCYFHWLEPMLSPFHLGDVGISTWTRQLMIWDNLHSMENSGCKAYPVTSHALLGVYSPSRSTQLVVEIIAKICGFSPL